MYIGDVSEGQDVTLTNANFTLLGHLKLSENIHTHFRARELKSLALNCTGVYVKLILYKNFVNRLNLYNQVGDRCCGGCSSGSSSGSVSCGSGSGGSNSSSSSSSSSLG